MTNKEYANSLRRIADFYESAPDDFPQPDGGLTKHYNYSSHDNNKEKVRELVSSLGQCLKDYTGSQFTLIRDFEGLSLAFVFSREAVCERKVVGFKECEGYTIAPYKEEIVEWECKSILSPEEAKELEKSDNNIPF